MIFETQVVNVFLELGRIVFSEVPLLLCCFGNDPKLATFDNADPLLGRVVPAEGRDGLSVISKANC